MDKQVTNVVIAGLGGQGVLRSSDILGAAAFRAGLDVKKAEVHGMSQRGGSVASDVRIGRDIASPMVPDGEADYLVILTADELDANRHRLAEGGTLILPEAIDESALPHARSLNVALLGVLSRELDIDEDCWREAICAHFDEKLHETNRKAFALGRGGA